MRGEVTGTWKKRNSCITGDLERIRNLCLRDLTNPRENECLNLTLHPSLFPAGTHQDRTQLEARRQGNLSDSHSPQETARWGSGTIWKGNEDIWPIYHPKFPYLLNRYDVLCSSCLKMFHPFIIICRILVIGFWSNPLIMEMKKGSGDIFAIKVNSCSFKSQETKKLWRV